TTMKLTAAFVALTVVGLASAAIQPDAKCCDCIDRERCSWTCCLTPAPRLIPVAAPIEPQAPCCECPGQDRCSRLCCRQ
ncbi:hypothetical protein BG000_006162, partial [Podila horticola]